MPAVARRGEMALGRWQGLWIATTIAALLLSTLLIGYESLFHGRVPANVEVEGIKIGGMAPAEAAAALQARFRQVLDTPITLSGAEIQREATPARLGVWYDVAETLRLALAVGREGNPASVQWARLRTTLGASIMPVVHVHEDILDAWLAEFADKVDQEPVDAAIDVRNGQIVTAPASNGQRVDRGAVARQLRADAMRLSPRPISVTALPVPPTIGEEAIVKARRSAEEMVGQPVTLTAQNKTWTIKPSDLQQMLTFQPATTISDQRTLVPALDAAKAQAIVSRLTADFYKPPRGGFYVQQGRSLVPAVETQTGVALRAAALAPALYRAANATQPQDRVAALPLVQVKPRLTLAFDEDGSPATVQSILETLGKAHVKGSFYPSETWRQQHPDLTQNIALGHDLGKTREPGEIMQGKTPDELVASALTSARENTILVFKASDSNVAAALPRIVDALNRLNYEIVPLPQLRAPVP